MLISLLCYHTTLILLSPPLTFSPTNLLTITQSTPHPLHVSSLFFTPRIGEPHLGPNKLLPVRSFSFVVFFPFLCTNIAINL